MKSFPALIVTLVLIYSSANVHAAAKREPTKADVASGPHANQLLDLRIAILIYGAFDNSFADLVKISFTLLLF